MERDKTVIELFKENKLMSQIMRSNVIYDDVYRGLRLGLSVEEIIRIYEDYYEETGIKTYYSNSGHSRKIIL